MGPQEPRLERKAGDSKEGLMIGPSKEPLEPQASSDKSGTTYVPLPAIGFTRNEGYWIGGLVTTLKTNRDGEIEDIFAPQFLYNPLVGAQGTINYYGYRSSTVQYRAVASYSEKVAKYFELGYRNFGFGGGRYIFSAQLNWFKNPFARFFGFGNTASLYNETNYTSREGIAKVTIGVNLGPAASLTFTERYRDVRVEDGIISTLPSTKNQFPKVTGIDGVQLFGHQLAFLYDTRDDLLTPVRGSYLNISAELVQNMKHRGPHRWGFFAVDARHLIPHDGDSKVFVARVLFQSVAGSRVPFYERPTLGGENTLRAFGLQRYIDDQALLVNFEERMTVLKRRVFNNDLEFQVAPSIDIGRVTNDFGDNFHNFQVNPGVGFRALARPNVVGRVDVAYGKDGSNAFVGLDYPF